MEEISGAGEEVEQALAATAGAPADGIYIPTTRIPFFRRMLRGLFAADQQGAEVSPSRANEPTAYRSLPYSDELQRRAILKAQFASLDPVLLSAARRALAARGIDTTYLDDPLDTNCCKCKKALGPAGLRGPAIMSGEDAMQLISDRGVYACKSCGTPFCIDCMAEIKTRPCPSCKRPLGW